MPKLLQAAFTGGELSPSLYARVDLARWATSLRTCLNFIVRPHGGVMNRPGTQFVVGAKFNDKTSRLIPFVYSRTQTYMLEFSEGYITVMVDGAPLTGSAIAISNVVLNGSGPYTRTITTSSPHGLSVSDSVTISDVIATGTHDVNGSWTVLSVPSSTTFTIKPATLSTGAYLSGGQIDVYLDITNPYSEADLDGLRFTQSADVLTVVHPDYPVYEFRRLAASSFEFVEKTFTQGPFLDINVDTSIKVYASAERGSITLHSTEALFETGAHENALFYLEEQDYSQVDPWEPNKQIAASTVNPYGILCRSDGKVYKCVTNTAAGSDGTRTGTVRPTHTKGVATDGDGNPIPSTASAAGVQWQYLHSGYGIARISSISSPTQALANVLAAMPPSVVGGATVANGPWTFTGDDVTDNVSATTSVSINVFDYQVLFDGVIQNPEIISVQPGTQVDFYDPPADGVAVSVSELSSNNRSDVWALGAWSPDQGYPRTVTYYGDRLCFAGSDGRPQTMWLSAVGDYANFGKSTPSEDSDSITVTLNARQINSITDLIAIDSLVGFTANAAWRVTEGVDGVLTPSTIGFRPQQFRGSSDVAGVVVGDSALFAQVNGTKLRDLQYQFDVDKFAGNELSLMSEHLLNSSATIARMDFADEPYSVVWIVRSDGVLLSLTYMREHEVIGWARHTTDGEVEDVAVIPEDGEDRVYLLVKRTIDGDTVRYIERMASREFTLQEDAFFVDCGLTYDGRNTGSTTMTLSGSGWTPDDDLTLTASASTFASTDVGDKVVIDDLRLTIQSYNSATEVIVRPNKDVDAAYQNVATTSWGIARDAFTGAGHLEGKTLNVLGDGNVLPQVTVSGGGFSVPIHSVVLHAGLPITADMETLDINVEGAESVRGNAKAITHVGLIVQESKGIFVGPDADNLDEIQQRDDEDYDEAVELLTDYVDAYIAHTWSRNARVLVRHTDPVPLTLLGAIPNVEIGGSG